MMTTKEEKRELLHRKWEEQIAECESSNMPVKEWCAVNGVNLNTFYGRVSALKRERLKQSGQQTQEIVPLSVIQESGTTNSETVVPFKTKWTTNSGNCTAQRNPRERYNQF